MQQIVEALSASRAGEDGTELAGIGHRVVHGGEDFTEPTLIDEKVLGVIRRNVPLAPLPQPGQPDRHRGRPRGGAPLAPGRGLRYGLPPVDPAQGLPLRDPPRAVCPTTGAAVRISRDLTPVRGRTSRRLSEKASGIPEPDYPPSGERGERSPVEQGRVWTHRWA